MDLYQLEPKMQEPRVVLDPALLILAELVAQSPSLRQKVEVELKTSKSGHPVKPHPTVLVFALSSLYYI